MPSAVSIEQRLAKLESFQKLVTPQIARALALGLSSYQITPGQKAALPGALIGGGTSILDAIGLIGIAKVLVNGGTQVGGPITGVASPPTGISGIGGEVSLTSGTFSTQIGRTVNILIIGLCTDQVTCGVAHATQHPVYFQIDGVSESGLAWGVIPVYGAQTLPICATVVKVASVSGGSHTVKIIWNSEEAANDTIFNTNNPLYVFQLGS